MTEPKEPVESAASGDAPQLVQDAAAIVRDLYFKRLAGSLTPFDETVRRVLEACLRRGLKSGDASPEERDLAGRLGITA